MQNAFQPLILGTLSLLQQRSWSCALPSLHCQRAEAVVRPHVAATFGFRPRHVDTWQWSLVMGARLFLDTQGTVWWGGGEETMR